MTLWFEWKKPVKSGNTLNPEDTEGITDNNYFYTRSNHHWHINFRQLALTQGNSYIELPIWIAEIGSDKSKK